MTTNETTHGTGCLRGFPFENKDAGRFRTIAVYGTRYYPFVGMVDSKGVAIIGLFTHPDDASGPDADNRAAGSVSVKYLTADDREAARHNTELL